MTTRVEHLGVCKQGAIVRLEAGDLQGAIASMISDLRKADEPLYDAALLRALLADALSSATRRTRSAIGSTASIEV